MSTNASPQNHPPEEILSDLLNLIGQPVRIRLILAIGKREVCVCHLESVTGMRQAAISQHLMRLREAGWVVSERSGRHFYYRLARPECISFIRSAAALAGDPAWVDQALSLDPVPGCPCPECSHAGTCTRITDDVISSTAPEPLSV